MTSEAMADRAKTLIQIIPNIYGDFPYVRYYAKTLTCIVYRGKSENCLWPGQPSNKHCLHCGAYPFTFFLSMLHFCTIFPKMSSHCIHCSINWFFLLSQWTVNIFAMSISSDLHYICKYLQRISLHHNNEIHQSIILRHFSDLQSSLLASIFVMNMMALFHMFLYGLLIIFTMVNS